VKIQTAQGTGLAVSVHLGTSLRYVDQVPKCPKVVHLGLDHVGEKDVKTLTVPNSFQTDLQKNNGLNPGSVAPGGVGLINLVSRPLNLPVKRRLEPPQMYMSPRRTEVHRLRLFLAVQKQAQHASSCGQLSDRRLDFSNLLPAAGRKCQPNRRSLPAPPPATEPWRLLPQLGRVRRRRPLLPTSASTDSGGAER
jgi:hypothetical protein